MNNSPLRVFQPYTIETLRPNELLSQMSIPWHGGLFGFAYPGFKYLTRQNLLRDTKRGAPYVQNIVAKNKDKVVGVLTYTWMLHHPYAQFPHYELSFVDVHKKYQGQGIARLMIEKLDESPSLSGEVLRITPPGSNKTRNFPEKIETILTARNYGLLPDEFGLHQKPKSPRGIVGELFDEVWLENGNIVYMNEHR